MVASTNILALTAILPAAVLAQSCASGSIPASTGSETLSEPQYIAAGDSFDGGFVTYGRGSGACGSGEGGEADTVFVLEDGASLSNVIIGADQQEGVYCLGACSLSNVWFEDVCEDAISLKGDGDATITGGGAFNAADKIIQHNGCGSVTVSDFYAESYGKVYRSCGNCDTQCARTVSMTGVTAVDGGELMGINSNLGDTAEYSGNCADATECQDYVGCEGDCQPEKAGTC